MSDPNFPRDARGVRLSIADPIAAEYVRQKRAIANREPAMTMREKIARALFMREKNGMSPEDYPENYALNVWSHASDEDHKMYIELADIALDCLTVRPSEAMIRAACEEARKEQMRPVSINRVDAAMVWETMVRTMIEEGK